VQIMSAFDPLRRRHSTVSLVFKPDGVRYGLLVKKDLKPRFARVVAALLILAGVYGALRYGNDWAEAISRFILALN
jgi:hypothetical protein